MEAEDWLRSIEKKLENA
jgi:hypothetical protein